MNRIGIPILVVCALSLLAVGAWAATGDLFRSAVLGGVGGRATVGELALEEAMGQPVAGGVAGGSLGLCSGLWCGGPREHTAYVPLALRNFVSRRDASDLCGNAEPVVLGAVYRDDFDHYQDSDWYVFRAVAGQTYTIRTFDLGANADTLLFLHGSCEMPHLAYNDDDEGGLDGRSKIVWSAPASGVYRVGVLQYDYTIYGPGTGYAFQVLLGGTVKSAVPVATTHDKPTPLSTPASPEERKE